jgi:hypothetical protein
MRVRSIVAVVLTFGSLLLALTMNVTSDESRGPRVKLTVQATDSSGGSLHYRWRSTDGHLNDIDSATTSWELPAGGGIHFAYVLVSNGLGGYTERRIAINTDGFARRSESDDDADGRAHDYRAPPAPAQVGDYFRIRLAAVIDNPLVGNRDYFYLPNVRGYALDQTNLRHPPSGFASSDLKGELVIPGLPPGNFNGTCILFGVSTTNCFPGSGEPMAAYAFTEYFAIDAIGGLIGGTVTLFDGTPCGTVNEFFGVRVTATATVLDAANKVLVGPVAANEFGDYALPFLPAGATVLLNCEGAVPISLAFPKTNTAPLPTKVVLNVTPPTVVTITASLGGSPLTAPVAKFLPPDTGLPSSNVAPRADIYLAEKGIDSRLGACKYYLAIGAVKGCGTNGELLRSINYREWQKAVKIGRFARGAPTYKAAYINKVDLNLARVHESVTYGPNQTAAVVCNHVGASDFFNPTQADIDTAVLNAVFNKNLVACVAMDYMISPGVNGDKPFIRFLIFGPSGELLPSVNLDGRREKFVPGTCVVCHGGDHYAGKFPEDGSGFANVGGHFLPYDVGNFEFASTAGLRKCDQQEAIYHLNQNVLQAGPTPAAQDLIAGWYASLGTVQCPMGPPTVGHVLNEDYVSPSWATQGNTAVDFYKNAYARSCRTCHVNMVEEFNFEHYDNVINGFYTALDFEATICGSGSSFVTRGFQRHYTMPNSLVTFNRFWLTEQNPVGLPDQVLLLKQFIKLTIGDTCSDVP